MVSIHAVLMEQFIRETLEPGMAPRIGFMGSCLSDTPGLRARPGFSDGSTLRGFPARS